MKLRILLLVLLPIHVLVASEYGKWLPSEKYVHEPEFEKPLKIAKTWITKRTNAEKEKIQFEYHVSKSENQYIISVNFLYPGEGEEYIVAIDGEECIYVSKAGVVVDVKQCMAP